MALELGSLMFQLGLGLTVAFIGAALALRFHLSAILGYLVAGILVGPHIHVSIAGLRYDGLVQETDFMREASQLGLVLLLFFVGLGFPASKLRRTRGAATILAVVDLGLSLFIGFLVGAALGWPLVDTVFLAGVVAMSSSSVAAKSLMELGKLSDKEADFLLGMAIMESFMAMFLLTAMNGLVVQNSDRPTGLGTLALGVMIFIAFFAFLALLVIPRVAALFQHMRNDELFILSALGLVLMAAALAEVLFLPAIIGAFFIGMAFAESKLHDRLASKMESLRDAFVAFFFLSFGMGIDPGLFPRVLGMVALAVPLILVYELLIMGVLAYLLGFEGRAALVISSGLVARNEEAILYASVGTKAIQSNPSLSQAYAGELLGPFASLVCIITTTAAPMMMKASATLARAFGRLVPRPLAFGGSVIRGNLRTLVLPPAFAVRRRHLSLTVALGTYSILAITLVVGPRSLQPLIVALAALPLATLAIALRSSLGGRAARTYAAGVVVPGPLGRRLTLQVTLGALAFPLATILLWPVAWQFSLMAPLGFVALALLAMRRAYRRASGFPRSRPFSWRTDSPKEQRRGN